MQSENNCQEEVNPWSRALPLIIEHLRQGIVTWGTIFWGETQICNCLKICPKVLDQNITGSSHTVPIIRERKGSANYGKCWLRGLPSAVGGTSQMIWLLWQMGWGVMQKWEIMMGRDTHFLMERYVNYLCWKIKCKSTSRLCWTPGRRWGRWWGRWCRWGSSRPSSSCRCATSSTSSSSGWQCT